MALFKIEKGLASNLVKNRPKANEGWAYFTTDDGKFYIDIAGNGTQDAQIGVNRIPLNAATADKLSSTLSVEEGGTGLTAFTPNRIYFASTLNELYPSSHFIDPESVAINSTSKPQQSFFVNGSSKFADKIILQEEKTYGETVPAVGEEGQIFFELIDESEYDIPEGGEQYSVLVKNSDDDFDASWTQGLIFKNGKIQINPSIENLEDANNFALYVEGDMKITGSIIGSVSNAHQVDNDLVVTLNNVATAYNGSEGKYLTFYAPTTGISTADSDKGHFLVNTSGSSAPVWSTYARIDEVEGTTSAMGKDELRLGNNLASGVDKNRFGQIFLYSTSTGGGYITSKATTGTWNHILPAADGYLIVAPEHYVEGNSTEKNVLTGNYNNPIYIDAEGVATPISATIDASIAAGADYRMGFYSSAASFGPAQNHYVDNYRVGINYTNLNPLTTNDTTVLYVNGDETLIGDLKMKTDGSSVHWNDGAYQQRIKTTDDADVKTPVFSFQQSENSGNDWNNLLVIKDRGDLQLLNSAGRVYKENTEDGFDKNYILELIDKRTFDKNSILQTPFTKVKNSRGDTFSWDLLSTDNSSGTSISHYQLSAAREVYSAGNLTTPTINSSTALDIDLDGNLGVGDQAATKYRLYVNGDSNLNGSLTVNTNLLYVGENPSDNFKVTLDSNGNLLLHQTKEDSSIVNISLSEGSGIFDEDIKVGKDVRVGKIDDETYNIVLGDNEGAFFNYNTTTEDYDVKFLPNGSASFVQGTVTMDSLGMNVENNLSLGTASNTNIFMEGSTGNAAFKGFVGVKKYLSLGEDRNYPTINLDGETGDVTISGNLDVGGAISFENEANSANSLDDTAAVVIQGGVSVKKTLSAGAVRVDANETTKGCNIVFNSTDNYLAFIFD